MKRLFAPWRAAWIKRVSSPGHDPLKVTSQECVFCGYIERGDDDQSMILKRFKFCFVIMNGFPYNSGHLMVLPYRHVPDLLLLNQDERHEIIDVVSLCTKVLDKALNIGGFNIGINLGLAGGGGLPSHLHVHVLPRHRGDTNFLETLGQVKVVSQDMRDVYKQLKPFFDDESLIF